MPRTSLPLSAQDYPYRRKPSFAGIALGLSLIVLSVSAFSRAANAQAMIPTLSETSLTYTTNSDGSVTFKASITTTDRAPATGSVKFVDETTQTLIGVVDALEASIRVPQLPPGEHSVRAYYSGSDGVFPYVTGASASPPLQYASLILPRVDLATLQDVAGSQLVTLTATVTAPDAKPRGLVVFKTGDRVLATQALDSSGRAAFITSALDEGSHRIVAAYQGSATLAPAVSTTLIVDVGQDGFNNALVVRGPSPPNDFSSLD